MDKSKMTLSGVAKILEENNSNAITIEEWIPDFMNGLVDNFEFISTTLWTMQDCIELVLGINEDDDGFQDIYNKALLIYFKEILSGKGGKEYLEKIMRRLKKVNEFFEEFDI